MGSSCDYPGVTHPLCSSPPPGRGSPKLSLPLRNVKAKALVTAILLFPFFHLIFCHCVGQDPGRKWMTHSNEVIWGELVKGIVLQGVGRCREIMRDTATQLGSTAALEWTVVSEPTWGRMGRGQRRPQLHSPPVPAPTKTHPSSRATRKPEGQRRGSFSAVHTGWSPGTQSRWAGWRGVNGKCTQALRFSVLMRESVHDHS